MDLLAIQSTYQQSNRLYEHPINQQAKQLTIFLNSKIDQVTMNQSLEFQFQKVSFERKNDLLKNYLSAE